MDIGRSGREKSVEMKRGGGRNKGNDRNEMIYIQTELIFKITC